MKKIIKLIMATVVSISTFVPYFSSLPLQAANTEINIGSGDKEYKIGTDSPTNSLDNQYVRGVTDNLSLSKTHSLALNQGDKNNALNIYDVNQFDSGLYVYTAYAMPNFDTWSGHIGFFQVEPESLKDEGLIHIGSSTGPINGYLSSKGYSSTEIEAMKTGEYFTKGIGMENVRISMNANIAEILFYFNGNSGNATFNAAFTAGVYKLRVDENKGMVLTKVFDRSLAVINNENQTALATYPFQSNNVVADKENIAGILDFSQSPAVFTKFSSIPFDEDTTHFAGNPTTITAARVYYDGVKSIIGLNSFNNGAHKSTVALALYDGLELKGNVTLEKGTQVYNDSLSFNFLGFDNLGNYIVQYGTLNVSHDDIIYVLDKDDLHIIQEAKSFGSNYYARTKIAIEAGDPRIVTTVAFSVGEGNTGGSFVDANDNLEKSSSIIFPEPGVYAVGLDDQLRVVRVNKVKSLDGYQYYKLSTPSIKGLNEDESLMFGVASINDVDKFDASSGSYTASYIKFIEEWSLKQDFSPEIKKSTLAPIEIVTKGKTKAQIEAELLANIEMKDDFTSTEVLQSRLNRNPLDLTADIDWQALGLDMSRYGTYQVTYFVTDTSSVHEPNQTIATRTVTLTSGENTKDDGSGFIIDADNQTINFSDIGGLPNTALETSAVFGGKNLVDYMNAVAFSKSTRLYQTVNVVGVSYNELKNATTVGTYAIGVNALNPANNQLNSTSPKITVVDNQTVTNNKYAMRADSFSVSVGQMDKWLNGVFDGTCVSLNDCLAKTSGLYAWDRISTDPIALNTLTYTSTSLSATAGNYPVSFSYGAGTDTLTKTISVQVVGDHTNTDGTNTLTASDLSMTWNEFEIAKAGQSPQTLSQIVLARSSARAFDPLNVTLSGVAADTTNLELVTTVGTYPVIITQGTMSVTVLVSILPENNQIITEPSGTYVIGGQNVRMHINDFNAKRGAGTLLDDLKAISLSRVWTVANPSVDLSDSMVTDIDLLNGSTTIGTYPMYISYVTPGSQTISATILVTLYDDNTVIKPVTPGGTPETWALSANDFSVSLSDVVTAQATDAALTTMFITHSSTRVWIMNETNTALVPVVIDLAKLKGITTAGVYGVSVSHTSGGATISTADRLDGRLVYVTVVDDNTVIDNDYMVRAVNGTMTLSDFTAYATDADLLKSQLILALQASGVNRANGVALTLDVDVSGLPTATPKSGVFPVTFTYDTVTRTVYLLINGGDITIDQPIAITGNNIEMLWSDYTSFKGSSTLEAQVKALADIRAYNVETGTALSTTLNMSVLNGATKTGTYPVVITADGKTRTILVTLKDPNTKIENGWAIQGKDITMSLAQYKIAQANPATLKLGILTATDARAWVINASQTALTPVVIVNEASVLGATSVGTYPVTLRYTNGSQTIEKTVLMNLTSTDITSNDGMSLAGSNFKTPFASFKELTDANKIVTIKSSAAVKGWYYENTGAHMAGELFTNSIQYDLSAITAATKPGVYPVVLSYTNDLGKTITRTIYITLSSADVVDNGVYAIYGNDYEWNIADYETSQTDGTLEDDIKALSNASAWYLDGQAIDVTDISVDYATLLNAELGTYAVTLSFQAGANSEVSHVIYVTITDDSVVIDETMKVAVNAIDHTMTLTELKTQRSNGTLNAYLNTNLEISAWRTNAANTPLTPTVNYSAVQNATIGGVYPVTVSYTENSKTVSKTVAVLVMDEHTVIDPGNNIGMTANNFTQTLADVETKTTAEIEALVSANANISVFELVLVNNQAVMLTSPAVTMNVSSLEAATTAGTYPVVLTYSDGTRTISTTIQVTLTDKNTVTDKDWSITASDFSVDLADYTALNAAGKTAALMSGSTARAWNNKIGVALTTPVIVLDESQIGIVAGTYSVGVTYNDGVRSISTSFLVTLTKAGTVVDPVMNVAVNAIDHTMTLAQLKAERTAGTLDAYLNTHLEISAWRTDQSNVTLTPAVDRTSLLTASTGGVYPVTVSFTENGKTVSKTVAVLVMDEHTVIDPVNNIGITANNFTQTLADIEPKTTAELETLVSANANISVFELALVNNQAVMLTSPAVTMDVSSIELATAAGTYPVILTYNDGTRSISTTIQVTLNDGNTVTDTDWSITASNFSYDVDDFNALTATQKTDLLKAQSNARAWNNTNGVSLTPPALIFNESQVGTVVGTYKVDVKYDNGTRSIATSFYITLTNKNTVIDEVDADTWAISGNDFTMTLKDLKAIQSNEAGLKDLVIAQSVAKAWSLPPATAETAVPTIALNDLKTTHTVGTYTVGLSYTKNGDTIDTTIKVTVEDDSVVTEGTWKLSAYDVEMTFNAKTGHVNSNDLDQALLQASSAKAWNSVTLGALTPLSIDPTSTVNGAIKPGIYNATVTYFDGFTNISKVIKVTLTGENVVTEPGVEDPLDPPNEVDYKLSASHLTTTQVAFNGASDKAQFVLDGTQAFGWIKGTDRELTPLTVSDLSGLVVGPNTVTISYTDTNGKKIEINVIVTLTGDNTVIDNVDGDTWVISGNNFTMSLDDLKAVQSNTTNLSNKIVTESQAKAWTLPPATPTSATPVVALNDLATTTTVGTYTVGLSHTVNGEVISTTIKVTVEDDSVVTDGTWKLSAYDVEMRLSEKTNQSSLGSLDQALLQASTAKAWDSVTLGVLTPLSIDMTAVEAATKPGVYNATVSYTNGTMISKQIKVILTGDNVVTKPDVVDPENEPDKVDYKLSASHFTTTQVTFNAEVNKEAFVLDGTHAFGWIAGTGRELTPLTVSDLSGLKLGPNEVTISYKDSLNQTIEIKVIVTLLGTNTKDEEVEDPTDPLAKVTYLLSANDATIKETDYLSAVNKETFIVAATEATAWIQDTNTLLTPVITSDLTQIHLGPNTITMMYKDSKDQVVSLDIVVTMIGDQVVEDTEYMLSADNMRVAEKAFAAISDKEGYVLNESHAKAWEKATGLILSDVHTSDLSNLVVGPNVVNVSYSDGVDTIDLDIIVTIIGDNFVELPNVEDPTDPGKTVTYLMSANHVTYAKKDFDANTTQLQSILTDSKVKVWIDGTAVALSPITSSSLTGLIVGPNTVTLSYTDAIGQTIAIDIRVTLTGDQTTVKPDVEDPLDNTKKVTYMLSANHFNTAYKEFALSTDKQAYLENLASVQGWVEQDGRILTPVEVATDLASIQSIGPKAITFRYTDTNNEVIEVTVIGSFMGDKYSYNEEINTYLTANNVQMNLADFMASTDQEQLVLTSSDAVAWLNQSLMFATPLHIKTDLSAIKTTGALQVEVVYEDGQGKEVSTMITLSLLSDHGKVTPDGTLAIDANNATVSVEDAKAVTNIDELLILATSAKGWVTEDGTPTVVTVKAKGFNAIEVGTYDVTFITTHDGQSVETTVKVTFKDEQTIIDEALNWALYSKNVVMTLENYEAAVNGGVVDETIITLSGAKAWNTVTNHSLSPISIDRTHVTSKVGTYEVGTSYRSGANMIAKTVSLTLTNENTVIDDELKLAISGNNVSIGLNELKAKVEDGSLAVYLHELSQAKAWQMKAGGEVYNDVLVNVTPLLSVNAPGEYAISVSYKDLISTQIKVTVYDDSIHSNWDIKAQDFEITLEALKTIMADKDTAASKLQGLAKVELVELVQAQAFAAMPEISIDLTSIKLEAGKQTITIKLDEQGMIKEYKVFMTVTTKSGNDLPNTGLNSNIVPISGVIMVSGLVLVVGFKKKKNKQNV